MIAVRLLTVAVSLTFGAAGATAATLNVVDGRLIGASGVDRSEAQGLPRSPGRWKRRRW